MAFINLGQILYPIGSIYVSISDISPSAMFGGTWEAVSNGYTLRTRDASEELNTYVGSDSHLHYMPMGYDENQKVYYWLNGDNQPSYGSTVATGTTAYHFSPNLNSSVQNTWSKQANAPIRLAYVRDSTHIPRRLVVNMWKRIS